MPRFGRFLGHPHLKKPRNGGSCIFLHMIMDQIKTWLPSPSHQKKPLAGCPSPHEYRKLRLWPIPAITPAGQIYSNVHIYIYIYIHIHIYIYIYIHIYIYIGCVWPIALCACTRHWCPQKLLLSNTFMCITQYRRPPIHPVKSYRIAHHTPGKKKHGSMSRNFGCVEKSLKHASTPTSNGVCLKGGNKPKDQMFGFERLNPNRESSPNWLYMAL